MRAALFDESRTFRLVSMDLRSLRDDEVLVKVEACGVCGTDVHIVAGESRSTPPVVLGHEFAGSVVDGRGEVSKEFLGRRVAIDPNISCGRCYYCRRGLVHLCKDLRALGVDIHGGMAEFCIVPVSQLLRLPEDMNPDLCAFVEPVSCAVHGIDRAGIKTGDSVVILGGGTIGLMMLRLAKHAGAAAVSVVEPLGWKRELASRLGADHICDPSEGDVAEQMAAVLSEGADVVLECVGKAATMELAIHLARRGGTVEFFGVAPIGVTIPLEPNLVYGRELTIVGSYVNPFTFDRAANVLNAGIMNVDLFKVDHFPLDGAHEALRYQREGLTLKSIIHPQEP